MENKYSHSNVGHYNSVYNNVKIMGIQMLTSALLLLGMTLNLTGVVIRKKAVREYEKNYSLVSKIIDLNKDEITSNDEWSLVYKELNIPYDNTQPKKLKNNQLEGYLSKH